MTQVNCLVGIDLGSTTTKAVFMDARGRVLGKGITNSRSNYEIACQIAREEGEIATRFFLLQDHLREKAELRSILAPLMAALSARFALAQHRKQLRALREECFKVVESWPESFPQTDRYREALDSIFTAIDAQSDELFQPGARAQSDFFRDIATSLFLREADQVAKKLELTFDKLIGVFDRAILKVENQSFAACFTEYLDSARRDVIADPAFSAYESVISAAVNEMISLRIPILRQVGTGYGRLTLPFPKDQIRSEILCHGLGAHAMFPGTRTVLDIGGQDTKAIQVDTDGVVTSFQMNDRCAAGCGRYLGYIADEMNMGVHQLGPLALKSKKPARINSTCTVFAGAELRERLSLGENREDILAGLHRAIILRAMSLLARSGGVTSEFTFTGGVARNAAATQALKLLVFENYGEVKTNISEDSIYMGALGAALFARRDAAA